MPVSPPVGQPAEDDREFNCAIHGNRVCGNEDGTLTWHAPSGASCTLVHTRDTWDGESLQCQPNTTMLPDTSAYTPTGLPLDGIGLVLVLLVTLIFGRKRTN